MLRSHLEFRASALLDIAGYPRAPSAERLARLLAARLPGKGFDPVSVAAEDWGWRVQIAHDAFPLWIGCGHYAEYPDGLLCFIEPSKPYLRRWFGRIPTGGAVNALAEAIERIVHDSGAASDIRWWTDAEVARG